MYGHRSTNVILWFFFCGFVPVARLNKIILYRTHVPHLDYLYRTHTEMVHIMYVKIKIIILYFDILTTYTLIEHIPRWHVPPFSTKQPELGPFHFFHVVIFFLFLFIFFIQFSTQTKKHQTNSTPLCLSQRIVGIQKH